MQEFEIQPLVGIGPIKLGMSRAEVEALLGKPRSADGLCEEFLPGFFVGFDEEHCVEILRITDTGEFRGVFEGQHLLKLTYPDALAHLRQFGEFDGDLLNSLCRELAMALERGIPQGRFETLTLGCAGYFD